MERPLRYLAVACFAMLLPATAAPAQDLAGAAAREKERRKSVHDTANKVYTEDDLKGAKGTVNTGPVDKTAKPATTTTSPTSSGEEAGWRSRADRTRQAVAAAAAKAQAAEAQVQAIQARTLASTDTNEILRLQAQKKGLEQSRDAARQAEAEARAQQTALEEEARSRNIPPGWLRER